LVHVRVLPIYRGESQVGDHVQPPQPSEYHITQSPRRDFMPTTLSEFGFDLVNDQLYFFV
jgi:hypothetical protein